MSNLMDKNPLMAHIAHCSDPACPICQPVTTPHCNRCKSYGFPLTAVGCQFCDNEEGRYGLGDDQ